MRTTPDLSAISKIRRKRSHPERSRQKYTDPLNRNRKSPAQEMKQR